MLTPRKIPQQPRALSKVAAILDSAALLLESAGLSGFNTNAVAAGAGMSVGSLYQYFPDKDAIAAALIRREAALLLADAVPAQTMPGGREALILLIQAVIGHHLRRPVLARLLGVEAARLPLDADHRGVTRHLHRLVEAALLKPGVPRMRHALAAAHDVVAIMIGMVDAAAAQGERDAAALAQRVRAAVFGYLDRRARATEGGAPG